MIRFLWVISRTKNPGDLGYIRCTEGLRHTWTSTCPWLLKIVIRKSPGEEFDYHMFSRFFLLFLDVFTLSDSEGQRKLKLW